MNFHPVYVDLLYACKQKNSNVILVFVSYVFLIILMSFFDECFLVFI